MNRLRSVVFLLLFWFFGCSDFSEPKVAPKNERGALARKERIRILESELESLKWENTRLVMKIRTVNGTALVKDKKTGLWHYDVERVPYTGMVVEKFPDGSPRAEASFLKGRKDGMERFWYSNGQIKEQSHWFDGLANGIMTNWKETGEIDRIVRYKKGDLSEVVKE